MEHTVLVTGATAGFGEATARRFLANDHQVIALGRRVERLEALKASLPAEQQKKWFQIDFNVAENKVGQLKFAELFDHRIQLAWPRAHVAANAVYLSPWPYRPTAVENGVLGAWAKELGIREGYPLEP